MHIDLSRKLYLQGPSVVPDFQCPKTLPLIFELRSAGCLESLPLLSSKTPRKNSSCKCNVSCCCERLPDVRSHLRPRWSRRTINHNASHSTKTACRTRSGRLVGGACTPLVLRSLIRQDWRQLSFAAVLSFYPF